MKRIPNKVIVVDVEATCWERDGAPPRTQEIIEIGACVLYLPSGERDGQFSIMVRPTSGEVSPFCTSLTGITPEEVNGGVSFAEACEKLRATYLDLAECGWASFGNFDRMIFTAQCAREGVPYPFGPSHSNIKYLCALLDRSKERGMMDQLATYGLPHTGTHHRAADDAWNIAAIFEHLIRRGNARMWA